MLRRRWMFTAMTLLAGSPPMRAASEVAERSTSGSGGSAASSDVPTIAVLDFELIDEQDNPATQDATARRLQDATVQLRQELIDRGLYRLKDVQPAAELLTELRAQQAYLHRCNGCAEQVGKLLDVDLVMTCWVQKVSELILNVNVQIQDVASGRTMFSKSVDLRGNTDTSWTRGVHYLVRDMAEKRALDSTYGR